jgi:hypothetical protein
VKECSLCHGVGWVFDCKPSRDPLNVEIIKCPIPDCKSSGKSIVILSVNELDFHRVTYHPTSGMIMAIRK